MKRLRLLLLCGLLLQNALGGIAAAQSGVATKTIQPSQSGFAVLSNQDLVELQQAKLTPEEMIAKIKGSRCAFDLSPPALKSLRSAGISADVITVVIQATEALSRDQAVPRSTAEEPEQIVVPAGTQVDVEAAYTVSSLDVRAGDLISFRVLVPIRINGVTLIEKGALVTGRILEAKRGGHWGKAGQLSWTMQDLVAVDSTPISLQAGAEAGSDRGNSKKYAKLSSRTHNSVKGTSHGGEVAARMIIAGAIFPPLAPLALIHGFKRGENAVLPEGKRFVVFVQGDTGVQVHSP